MAEVKDKRPRLDQLLKHGDLCLHVRVVEARVKKMDRGGTADAYVKLRLGTNKTNRFKTKVIPDTLAPVWNESFTLQFSRKDMNQELDMKVRDHDKWSRDDHIGTVNIALTDLDEYGAKQGWFNIALPEKPDVTRGRVFVQLQADYRRDVGKKKKKKEEPAFMSHRLALMHNLTMLEEAETHSEDVKAFVGTWNVGNAPPPADLSPWIPNEGFALFIIGVQECKYGERKPHSNCRADWEHALASHFGAPYMLLACKNLLEIRLHVFVLCSFRNRISNVKASKEATGLANVVGNKGGVAISLNIDDTSICFVNSHLAAHQGKVKERNEDFDEILKGIRLGEDGMDLLHQFDHVVWMGDLNYRIDYRKNAGGGKTPTKELHEDVVHQIKRHNYKTLLATDQLRNEMKADQVFQNFEEGDIDFAPTFKVERGKKFGYLEQRLPSWCDRILWRSLPGRRLRLLEYGSAPDILSSDHKPVYGIFSISVCEHVSAVSNAFGPATLRITNLRGRNLPAADVGRTSDPYVVFSHPSFGKQKLKTCSIANTLNPVWKNEDVPEVALCYNNPRRLQEEFLFIKVFDHDNLSRDDMLGFGILPLHEFVKSREALPFMVKLSRGAKQEGVLEGVLEIEWAAPTHLMMRLPNPEEKK